jgi:hypothetical protein
MAGLPAAKCVIGEKNSKFDVETPAKRVEAPTPRRNQTLRGDVVSSAAQILWMPNRTRPIPPPQAPEVARFVCDPFQHQVHRLDASGQILDSFGEFGRARGQFDTPSDSAVVLPMFEEEDIAGCSRAAFVAVADRLNNRVQVFELEGQFVTALGEFSETGANADRPGREGWPYFRLTPHPVLNEPVRLRWEAPFLHIVDAQGHTTQVDLAYSMLPVFETWLANATAPTLVSAHHHFRFCVRHSEAMAEPLMRLETALGDNWLRSGDIDAVTRLWSLSWPVGLSAGMAMTEAARREQLATTAAFRFGSAQRVNRLRMALRLIAPAPPAGPPAAPVRLASPDRMCVGE